MAEGKGLSDPENLSSQKLFFLCGPPTRADLEILLLGWLLATMDSQSSNQSPKLNLPFSGWSLMSASLGWLGLSDWLESEKHKNTAKNYRVCERKWIRGGRLSQKVQRVNQEWEHYRSAMMIKKGRKKRRGEGQQPQQPVPSERTPGCLHLRQHLACARS